MKNQHTLAIIIPAYKSTFLSAALNSIAAQTCKDFTLYIGDDCSPHDIKGIVEQYTDKIDLVYQRFDVNLGGKDLVTQWERCIDMTQGEEWLWLFSDDDVMEAECVERFYTTIAGDTKLDIYHFDIQVINENGIITSRANEYPVGLSAWDFCKQRTDCNLLSFVVEYIFKAEVFYRVNRFQRFDMAWGSDVATVTKLIGNKTLGVVRGARVNWRRSEENISPNKSTEVSYRKLMAVADYADWINRYFHHHGRFSLYLLWVYLKRYKQYAKFVQPEKRRKLEDHFINRMGWCNYALLVTFLLRAVRMLSK